MSGEGTLLVAVAELSRAFRERPNLALSAVPFVECERAYTRLGWVDHRRREHGKLIDCDDRHVVPVAEALLQTLRQLRRERRPNARAKGAAA